MNKRFLTLTIAFIVLSTTTTAQSEVFDEVIVPQQKHSVSTNHFWSNWFVSAGGGYMATYSSQEAKSVPTSPFARERRNVGFMLSVGKWITPHFGMRLTMQGVEDKAISTRTSYHQFDAWNGHIDALFNLSNFFGGYNEQRVWNLVPYAGVGVARNMTHNRYAPSYSVGLYNSFRISTRLSLFVDVYANAITGDYDADVRKHDNLWTSRHWDKHLGANVGLTLHLGKSTWQHTPDVDALIAMNREQLYALTTALEVLEGENERLRAALDATPTTIVTDSVEQYTLREEQPTKLPSVVSVFFELNRSNVASKKDLVDVRTLANYAKAHGKTLIVKGYADHSTGSQEYNHLLATKRANTVADLLVKFGVEREHILIHVVGGTQELTPISYNRRVTVETQ